MRNTLPTADASRTAIWSEVKMKQDLLKQIEENMPHFSKRQKQISLYLLDNYDKAAYMTASKLGAIVNVSESTVVRYANELGFDGYPQLQSALQELTRTRLTSFQRVEVTDSLIGDGDVLKKVLLSDAEKIKTTLDEIDYEAFNTAVEKICSARRIYVIGIRSSAALALFLRQSLNVIFDNVFSLEALSGHDVFEQLLGISEDDVLIAISFPRYSRRVIRAVEFASSHGANVISLTDSKTSPIADKASEVLVARSDMVSYVDSLVAPLSLINSLIIGISRKMRDQVDKRLRSLEAIWDEYEVYDKSHS